MKKLLALLSAIPVIFVATITSHSAPYWAKIYGSGNEEIYSMEQTTDGGYILAGYVPSYTDDNILIIKLDAEGEFSWDKIWGGRALGDGGQENGRDFACRFLAGHGNP